MDQSLGPAVYAEDSSEVSESSKVGEPETEAAVISLQYEMKWPEHDVVKKVELQLLMSYFGWL